MTKRRLLRWSLLLVLLAAFAVWLEPTRVVWGWLRGEAFYQGRPTSYWRDLIQQDLQTEPRVLFAKLYPPSPPPTSWWHRCKEWLGYQSRDESSHWVVTVILDTKAAGVLRALAEDPDEKIAAFASDLAKLPPWRVPQDYWLEMIQKQR